MIANIYLGNNQSAFDSGKNWDLAIVDPPYGDGGSEFTTKTRFGERFDRYKKTDTTKKVVSRTGGTWATKYGKEIIRWDEAPDKIYFDNLFGVSNNQIIWGGNYFTLPPTRCFLIWRKLTISEGFSMAMAEYAWTSFNQNAKIFDAAPQGGPLGRFHPTQKPIELYKWILKKYAKEGETILDTHGGSMSSVIACIDMGFDIDCWEMDPDYYAAAKKRIKDHCKQLRWDQEPPIINFYD